MKFLLTAVNAKYIHSNPAVYSLRAFVGEKLQPYVEIAEYTINHRKEDILGDIYGKRPDVIGFSCYIWNWSLIQELIVELHKILPGIPIWLGGPEVSFDAAEILEKYPQVTGIMVGEGEETFRDLLEYYVNCENDGQNHRLSHLSGLALRTGRTPERELTNLTEVPFLYHDLKPFENRIIYYESSRGCPYRCSYCLSSIDKKVRLRDISVVKEELQFFLKNRVPQVKFVDRTFNCDHAHAMEIWQYILENDNGVTNFHFEISADILREDELALLGKMRPGLVQLEIGVQTTNADTLKEIRRHMDLEKLEQIVGIIRQGNNIHQHLDLIAGLPYEDYDSFGRSFDRVYRMQPQQLQLGFLKVLKGSHMHDMAENYGLVYQSMPPYEVLYTKWLPYEKVLRLKRIEEMVEIYYNSNQFTHTLPWLEQAFQGPFAMYEALADFYEKKGYFVSSPSRAYRYEVLLAFAREHDSEREDLYRELLVYDLYLRENLKSRPEFALELEPYKKDIRRFYSTEEQERKYLPAYANYDARQLAKMTHLEPFYYPVWQYPKRENAVKNQDSRGKQPEYVLVDYRERNPLNSEARTVVVEMPDAAAEDKQNSAVVIPDTYVCIDLETTGLDPRMDRIIEIGAVKVEKGVQTGIFETFVNPGRRLEERIVELTGIRDEDLQSAPSIEQVLPDLLAFVGDMPLMGHSVLFDFSFVKKAAVNNKMTFEKNGIDTLKIARKYLPDLESRSLDYLCGYYGISHQAHRALEDARATVVLYEKMAEQFMTPMSSRDFQPYKLVYQAKRDTPATKPQIERLYKLLEKHKIHNDADLSRMTRSEVSRYTDQILARYGR